jgi:2'-5' RNA ligase
MDKMRAFIAVNIAADVLSEIDALVESIKGRVRGARWVAAANRHLTLRFLGEADAKVLSAFTAAVESSCREYESFTLEVRGIGFFPSAKKPRILWAGITRPPLVLGQLQNELEEAARRHGFEPERRRFSPHLTLARFRRPEYDPALIELAWELEGHAFGVSPVTETVLYQSILKPQGAEYRVLHRFPLEGTTERNF